jgi:Lrp/AsnC family leucine-responsive transcriptional regulator
VVTLDSLDIRILDALQADCAGTNHDLARLVHVSAATCLRRVKRLIEAGVIERQIAIVSPDLVARGLTAIVEVTLDRQSAEDLAAFAALIAAAGEVQQCYRVSSGPDFVLVVYAQDMDRYHAFVHRTLTAVANVRNVRAFFTVQRVKFAPGIPLR